MTLMCFLVLLSLTLTLGERQSRCFFKRILMFYPIATHSLLRNRKTRLIIWNFTVIIDFSFFPIDVNDVCFIPCVMAYCYSILKRPSMSAVLLASITQLHGLSCGHFLKLLKYCLTFTFALREDAPQLQKKKKRICIAFCVTPRLSGLFFWPSRYEAVWKITRYKGSKSFRTCWRFLQGRKLESRPPWPHFSGG